jgi:hypothetical protein
MAGAFALVADVVIGGALAAMAAGSAAVCCGWCWYGQPLLRRRALYAQARVGDGAVPWAVGGLRADDMRAAEGC